MTASEPTSGCSRCLASWLLPRTTWAFRRPVKSVLRRVRPWTTSRSPGRPGRAGSLPQAAHNGLGRVVPPPVELPARRVEEGHPGEVVHPLERGVQGPGQGVGRQDVQGPVDDERRRGRTAVQQLSGRTGRRAPSPPAGGGARARSGRAVGHGRARRAPGPKGGAPAPVPAGCSSPRSPRPGRRPPPGATARPCAPRGSPRPRPAAAGPPGVRAGTLPDRCRSRLHPRPRRPCPAWVRRTQAGHGLAGRRPPAQTRWRGTDPHPSTNGVRP